MQVRYFKGRPALTALQQNCRHHLDRYNRAFNAKHARTTFHHHKMPIKLGYDHRKRTLSISTIEYARGFRQYPISFWLCTLLLFLVELGCAILAAPSPMLLETAVCRHHFEKDRQLLNEEPTDEFCRSKEVQVHFAFVITVLSTLSTLAGTQNHKSPPRQRLTVQSDDDASPHGLPRGQRRPSACFYAEHHQYHLLLGMHSNSRYGVPLCT